MINFKEIYKCYKTGFSNTTWALKDINCSIRENEFLGLIGNNGAGKTTFLHLLLRFIEATSGKIEYVKKTETAFVPDILNIDDNLKTRKFLLNYLLISNSKSSKNILKMIDDECEYFGISDKLNIPVNKLSKGTKQIVQNIVCLLSESSMVVLDEPTAGLDPTNKLKLTNKLKWLQKKGKTIILSSHRLDEITDFCDRYLFLKNGTLEKEEKIIQSESLRFKMIVEPIVFQKLKSFFADINYEIDEKLYVIKIEKMDLTEYLNFLQQNNLNFLKLTEEKVNLEKLFYD